MREVRQIDVRLSVTVLFTFVGCPLILLSVLVDACTNRNLSPTTYDSPAVTVPFEPADTLVLIQARIGDSLPLWFVLDSGSARMLIDKKVADSLGLKGGAADSLSGAGAGRVPVNIIHDLSMQVGALRSEHYDFASTDLAGLTTVIGRPIDGIIGYEFLSRFVVHIDYARHEVSIRDAQAAFTPPGSPVPIELRKKWPFVRATLKVKGVPPVTDDFLVDSGSGDAVDHPVIKQSKGEVRRTTTGNGLGQPVSGYIGTAEALEIGPYKLENVSLACCGGTDETSRLIGGGVLSRFTVTFDYPHSRIFLAPKPVTPEQGP